MAEIRVQSVDASLVNNGVKCVVYGKAGVGKTRLVLTCPRPLIISAEKGLLSVKGNNLPMLPEITKLSELVECHNWCLNSKEAANYDTIFFDSISEIADVVLRTEKSRTKDGRKAHDDASEMLFHTVFRPFRDMPRKHVVFIARERSDEDQMTHAQFASPSMPNAKLREAIPHFFDYVFRYVHGQNMDLSKWQALQCHADSTAIAKSRGGNLGFWEAPDLGAIFAKAMQ